METDRPHGDEGLEGTAEDTSRPLEDGRTEREAYGSTEAKAGLELESSNLLEITSFKDLRA